MIMTSKLNDSQIKLLETYYLNNTISQRSLSDKSKEICGTKVSRNIIGNLARKYEWSKKKADLKNNTDKKEDTVNLDASVKKIAQILAKSIEKDWDENEEVDSQKVNAFMNVITKLGVDITPQGSSKSEIQMILEALD